MAAATPAPAPSPVSAPGSPAADALARFLRHRSAMAGFIVLIVIALAALLGPALLPNGYDRVFPDFVRAAPSLSAQPGPDRVDEIARRVASRARATVAATGLTGDSLRLILTATRPIDPRIAAAFDRSDAFEGTRIVETTDEGRRMVVETTVERHLFLFGTDGNGRDLLARTLVAARISLVVGLLASLVALMIGVAWGATAGYLGGRVDALMMRIVDILYALPFIFFVIMLVVFFGRHFVLVFVAIGAIEWLDMARIVRGQTLSLKRQEFVQAAEALGVSTAGIVLRHIVPNTLGTVVVYLTLLVPKVILIESFLSFLGLGVQEPLTSLGMLVSEGAKAIQDTTWLLIAPSAVLVALLAALNFVGDGLRDALDPRDR
ncbi:peptide ABC transporter permease [Prosthecomicrobium hirschii]|uniref:ABC transporter permease subunit n=1 Tax=Prosthecodimorpha hirschii TaxID=665126 RepID=UPI001125B760|nr:ABC transporter permease subunit [Prosthecomicrobium hirschii]TPQ51503.1 peptide ABC transporter permease [Prosthecomicrobium hirschii]